MLDCGSLQEVIATNVRFQANALVADAETVCSLACIIRDAGGPCGKRICVRGHTARNLPNKPEYEKGKAFIEGVHDWCLKHVQDVDVLRHSLFIGVSGSMLITEAVEGSDLSKLGTRLKGGIMDLHADRDFQGRQPSRCE